MERKEAVKIESCNMARSSPLFADHHHHHALGGFSLPGVFDFCDGDKSGSLGFMELLGMQDSGPSLLDVLQLPSSMVQLQHQHQHQQQQQPAGPNPAVAKESSEMLNQQPATPNSSSISSASSEALNDEPVKAVDDEEEEQEKAKKELKPKKTNQKRQREPRFAFMTKSEVDHLEDGYRWRKYGQKAVKNSSFPRSYYRCTNASCNVKKRVERSFNDPSVVVTTYEGQHTHPSPAMPRPSFIGAASASESGFSATPAFGMPMRKGLTLAPQAFSPLGFNYNIGTTNASFLHERRFCNTPGSALLQDHGLLQDIVPSYMLKEE